MMGAVPVEEQWAESCWTLRVQPSQDPGGLVSSQICAGLLGVSKDGRTFKMESRGFVTSVHNAWEQLSR